MKIRLLGAASALSILFLAGAVSAAPSDQPGHQSPASGSDSEALSAVKDTTAAAVGDISAEMTRTTKGFVKAAATGDLYEVEAGKIARRRAQSPAVRDFADHMITAHTQTTENLKSILASNMVNVTPPAHLDDRRQGLIDDLRGAKAADFDHRYLSQQDAAHKEAEILMRGYAKDGDNVTIKGFAADTLPIVEDHLAMVRKLEADQKTAER